MVRIMTLMSCQQFSHNSLLLNIALFNNVVYSAVNIWRCTENIVFLARVFVMLLQLTKLLQAERKWPYNKYNLSSTVLWQATDQTLVVSFLSSLSFYCRCQALLQPTHTNRTMFLPKKKKRTTDQSSLLDVQLKRIYTVGNNVISALILLSAVFFLNCIDYHLLMFQNYYLHKH